MTFLASKRMVVRPSGLSVSRDTISSALAPFQRELTGWALSKGRAALFADTGLGKTRMQVEFARLTGEQTLIVAPLSVARQTVREAKNALGIDVHYTRSANDLSDGINITNYEIVDHFNPEMFGTVILDESSILKAIDGRTRQLLTDMFAATPYRLCCTATPAPNDIAEIGNHSEFLGIMPRHEMLSAFFVHGDMGKGERQGWRLKGHAEQAFYRWLSSWAMSVRLPSDIGYPDDGYILPDLSIQPLWVDSDYVPSGMLFNPGMLHGIQQRHEVRRATMDVRCQAAADLVNGDDEQWIVWHGLNDEGYQLVRQIEGAVLVEGSDSPDAKAAAFESFQDGEIRVLVTKPSIGGFGLNLQNAHQMAFVGLNDSWEQYYQSIRRCWRFGQTERVAVHIVLSDAERDIYDNVMHKEQEARAMSQRLSDAVRGFMRDELDGVRDEFTYATDTVREDRFTVMLGDSAERLRELPDESVDLAVFSPPFSSLYTYSPTERDLGNSRSDDEFFAHFGYVTDQLRRVVKPGRNVAVHCMQVPLTKVRDGAIGVKDFRGDLIRHFAERGWIYHGEVCIDKNPQAQAIRTKAKGLLFAQVKRDRSWLRPALADYILVFRKPGENPTPILDDQITNEEWIEWAAPVWYGIRESATLNVAEARDEPDERHIAALQLETIRRCIRLWSNPGETVLDPFSGIGSTGYVAVQNGRQYVGVELKRSYFEASVRNLRKASIDQMPLFAGLGEVA